ncbi:MAG: NAD(P)/FAD-dependent oxidoreductase [Oligoflexus sp.]
MKRQESLPTSYDIIVIGAGVTGLSTAYHLEKKGYRQILILSSPQQADVTRHSAGLVAPGFIDNYTRVSHQVGTRVAADLWLAGNRAFEECRQFCEDSGISIKMGKRWRLASSEAEAQEQKQAVQQLQAAGFRAELYEPSEFQKIGLADLSPEIKAVQEEGEGGFCLEPQQLCDHLSRVSLYFAEEHVLKVQAKPQHMQVKTSRQTYQAEIVIVAAHTSVSELAELPDDSLVPYADQWRRYHVNWLDACPLPVGSVFSLKHGYFWGTVVDEQHLSVGGGRFIRPFAGIGASTASFEERISQLIQKELERSFTSLRFISCLEGEAGIEIRPCDELPVIGPKFGEPRLLLAAGFMGLGLSWGFWAGQRIAELVDGGQAATLPRQLWPERLRSWER